MFYVSLNPITFSGWRKLQHGYNRGFDNHCLRGRVNCSMHLLLLPSDSRRKDGDSSLSPWRDLINNPENWLDYRTKKSSGQVNPRHPDFKSKDGDTALWLNRSTGWVLSEIEGVKFDVQTSKSKYWNQQKKYGNQLKGDESWKDLLENPGNWWDNRLNKMKEKAPDFKHKKTGEGLWLNDSPAWVLPELPPPKGKKDGASSKRDTLLS